MQIVKQRNKSSDVDNSANDSNKPISVK